MKKHLLSFAATAGILFSTFSGTASAHENIYTVKSGDTLWKISQANKVSVANLKTWNHLTTDSVYVNQKLTLLAPHSHAATTGTYTVQKGDTLYQIAVRNKLTVSQLKSLNSLTSDTINVGQVLKVTATGTSTPVPTVSKVQMVMTEAKKYIGTPYLWGGNTPAGFDCSGLTSYVFNKAGITIPRTATTQWSGLKAVSTPKPGDLVFFETYAPGPTHVGIYLGNNQFIQAGSKGVSIADMTNSYWKP
ncbi:MAG: NlpC/P60 family protein, partial [Bacillus sp. (in: firmicutes)]